MKLTYLLVNFCAVIVPFVFSFHPRIKFNRNFPAFFKANLIVSALFLTWDAIFTANNVWSFSPEYTLGIKLYNLPLEEVLFFVCIPFACTFSYHCATLFFKIKWSPAAENIFVGFFCSLLLVTGIIFWERAYTSVTFIGTAIFLLSLKFYFKANWLPQFFTVYLFLLVPFFMVNGILTGTGLEEPVVAYNNAENLGIRLLTIPLEDVVYGMELVMLNVFLYERFKG